MLEVSRQEMIDRKMCRPGYRWDETLGRCLPAYAGGVAEETTPEEPTKETPDAAIKGEAKKRTKAKIVNSQPAPVSE